MGVSRAGYYKWKSRGKTTNDEKRNKVIELVTEVHNAHPSHGYRWVCAYIKINYGIEFSENYVYKAYNYLGFKSETKHKKRYRARIAKDKYPNLIYTTWETVDRPRQVIVSDMTSINIRMYYVEVTFYFDVYTKQILSYRIADRRGDRNQYLGGLDDIISLLSGREEKTILHTDQGSVYASIAYNKLLEDTNIQRSMSRAGKPTDNPVNESLNGWIKEELYIDFKLRKCRTLSEIREAIINYVDYYNKKRPCYSIGYNTPDEYYRKFIDGELEQKDTFSNRVLTKEPKFVQNKRRKSKEDL